MAISIGPPRMDEINVTVNVNVNVNSCSGDMANAGGITRMGGKIVHS